MPGKFSKGQTVVRRGSCRTWCVFSPHSLTGVRSPSHRVCAVARGAAGDLPSCSCRTSSVQPWSHILQALLLRVPLLGALHRPDPDLLSLQTHRSMQHQLLRCPASPSLAAPLTSSLGTKVTPNQQNLILSLIHISEPTRPY